MSDVVIVIGGYGVFGGQLAEALAERGEFDVIVAGRSEAKAAAFCKTRACRPLKLDVERGDFDTALRKEKPFLIIDAAGPFQAYGDNPYRVARAAIGCGAHYLDLSDDAAFTSGIRRLDEEARRVGLVVLSGVSSVPALSSAIAAWLAEDLCDIHLIESAILPGNRAPRGMSVVRAIVGQAGRPVGLYRAGRRVEAPGWSDGRAVTLEAGGRKVSGRWASLIGAPDLALFPGRFGARSVVFRAGLELKLMHGGLFFLSWLVRLGLMRSLLPLAPALKWIADRFEPFGSDIGGMCVAVKGVDAKGDAREERWDMIVGAGDGPKVPSLPGLILCRKIRGGETLPGARPCLAEFSAVEADAELSALDSQTQRVSAPLSTVFEIALGDRYATLPPAVSDLHRVLHARRWTGRARIVRGEGFLARAAAWVAQFPPSSEDTPVTVEMQRHRDTEIWKRTFGGRSFKSVLRPRGDSSGQVEERFGVFKFVINLDVSNDRLAYPVKSGALLGIPLPPFLTPRSDTYEFIDEKGRACFDVNVTLPLVGHVVSYSGWLEPADGEASGVDRITKS